MTNLVKFIGLLARPLLFLVYWLSGFSPRDSRIWVFGSWSGQRFADNSAALFEYVAARQGCGIRPVWISHDPDIVSRLTQQGYEAHYAWSPSGVRETLRAGVVIYDGLTKDVNHWTSRGAKKVLLRHGIGIKNIERAIDNPNHRLYQLFYGSYLQRLMWHLIIPWHKVKPDLAIASSRDHARQGERYFGLRKDQIVITGFPRNDRLIDGTSEEVPAPISAAIDGAHQSGRPVWLYMPTFRDDVSRFDLPLSELEQLAAELNILLLVKLHFVDGQRRNFGSSDSSETHLYIDARLDAQSLYPAVDGLISDYSSATFDFILTGNPVVLFTPDHEDYQKHSRSFYYDFEEIRPGPHVHTITDLATAIKNATADTSGVPSLEYTRAMDRFHEHRDANSCQRTFNEICRRFAPAASHQQVSGVKRSRAEA